MKHKISETGVRMLKYQEQLANEYKYKPIPRTFFKDVRAEFKEALPEWCNTSGDTISLETKNGTVITNGYNRIVISDYGAFVEFSRAQAYMPPACLCGWSCLIGNGGFSSTRLPRIACIMSCFICRISLGVDSGVRP